MYYDRDTSGTADRALRSKAKKGLKLMKRYAAVFPVGKPALLRWQGVHDRLRGKQRRAVRRLRAGVEDASAKGMRLEEALAHLELAQALGEAEGDGHGAAGKQILAEIGGPAPEQRAA